MAYYQLHLRASTLYQLRDVTIALQQLDKMEGTCMYVCTSVTCHVYTQLCSA
jgi:hypothetical protein